MLEDVGQHGTRSVTDLSWPTRGNHSKSGPDRDRPNADVAQSYVRICCRCLRRLSCESVWSVLRNCAGRRKMKPHLPTEGRGGWSFGANLLGGGVGLRCCLKRGRVKQFPAATQVDLPSCAPRPPPPNLNPPSPGASGILRPEGRAARGAWEAAAFRRSAPDRPRRPLRILASTPASSAPGT